MIQIIYDRSERQYVWTDPDSGEMFTFESGKAGKAQAWRFAISMLYPEIYATAERIIYRHPQLERVTWRGVELVTAEAVDILPEPAPGGVVAKVASSDGYGRYSIRVQDGYYQCECEHYSSFAAPVTENGARYCKHLIAYRIATA